MALPATNTIASHLAQPRLSNPLTLTTLSPSRALLRLLDSPICRPRLARQCTALLPSQKGRTEFEASLPRATQARRADRPSQFALSRSLQFSCLSLRETPICPRCLRLRQPLLHLCNTKHINYHRLAALLTKRPLINRTSTHFHHILATSYWVKGVARLPARIGKVRHSVFTTTTLAKKGSSRLAAA